MTRFSAAFGLRVVAGGGVGTGTEEQELRAVGRRLEPRVDLLLRRRRLLVANVQPHQAGERVDRVRVALERGVEGPAGALAIAATQQHLAHQGMALRTSRRAFHEQTGLALGLVERAHRQVRGAEQHVRSTVAWLAADRFERVGACLLDAAHPEVKTGELQLRRQRPLIEAQHLAVGVHRTLDIALRGANSAEKRLRAGQRVVGLHRVLRPCERVIELALGQEPTTLHDEHGCVVRIVLQQRIERGMRLRTATRW
jgi:hypothetical protein